MNGRVFFLLITLLPSCFLQLVVPETGEENGYKVPKTCSDRYEIYLYHSKEYIIQNLPLSWEDAQIICRGHYNGSLIELDTEAKADYVAEVLAESQFFLESVWVGARRTSASDPKGYHWEDGITLRRTSSDVMHGEDSYQGVGRHYPMWLNRTQVPVPDEGADCVAIGRVFHDKPVFIDLPCQLERGFICERESHAQPPVAETKTVKCKTGRYHVYTGMVNWDQAAAHCVLKKMQLANVGTVKCMKKLGRAMLKSRPSIENAWVGARGVLGNWTWLHGGVSIFTPPPYLDVSPDMWPPMKDRNVIKQSGCLQLDRHMSMTPMFLRSRCERKMQFICYDNKEFALALRSHAPLPSDDNYYYKLVHELLTWQQAFENCKSMNGSLGLIDTRETVTELLLVMGENIDSPVSHIWLSGTLNITKLSSTESSATWHNPSNGKQIVDPRNFGQNAELYMAPWLDEDFTLDNACLNLDRQNHLTGLVYGLPCDTLQYSICMIDKLQYEVAPVERKKKENEINEITHPPAMNLPANGMTSQAENTPVVPI